jgi:hypothetical protein
VWLRIYVVEEKRVGREEFLVVVGSCCVCFGEENLETKYAIVFLCFCSILSVYMFEGK